MKKRTKPLTALDRMVSRYFKAANALNRYREVAGFKPGVRVRAQVRDDPPLGGVIAPYGETWNGVFHTSVPVLLDSGHWQPWDMRHLTIVETRQQRWKRLHPEAVRAAQAALMRKRRAKK